MRACVPPTCVDAARAHTHDNHAGKFVVAFKIITEAMAVNDKVLIFSQSLFTLDLFEELFAQVFKWKKNKQYFRLDGRTSAETRHKQTGKFNADVARKGKNRSHVYLVSTKAGGFSGYFVRARTHTLNCVAVRLACPSPNSHTVLAPQDAWALIWWEQTASSCAM